MMKRYIFLSVVVASLFPSSYILAKDKRKISQKEQPGNIKKLDSSTVKGKSTKTKNDNQQKASIRIRDTVKDIKKKVGNASKKVIEKSKEIGAKIKQEAKKDIEKLKNPNYPNNEDDIIVKKGSKTDSISKKIENAKRDFYDYIDDDVRPLSILWAPGINWFWSSNGKAQEIKSFGWESVSTIRGIIMYDLQIGESHFFMSPGIGFSKQNYSFKNECIYEERNSKIKFKPAKDILNSIHGSGFSSKGTIRSISMSLCYLELLLELQFRSNRIYYKEGIFAALGINFGWMMSNPDSRIKYITNQGNATADKILTLSEPFGIKNYKLGIVARIGMGSFGVFIELVLTNLLNKDKMKDKGEVLKPITIGFTIDIV